ncbi:MAG TPA: hypothetical protein VFF70_07735 [Anaerolineae bacterium]|nr:hypothetical protein [Anaerolineae bacterium]
MLVVGIYAFCSCAFNLFLNWYDTGAINSEGWLPTVIGGAVFGLIAVSIERRIYYQRQELWPQKRLLFYVRLIILSIFYVDLGLGFGSGFDYMLREIFAGTTFFVALKDLLLVPAIVVFYWLMILPFGLTAGLLMGLLLRSNLSAQSFREDQVDYIESLG